MNCNYKELRHLSAEGLRSLCIKNNWYTGGNNAEYEHLLIDLADHKMSLTTADIIEIAEDIAEHSNLGGDWEIEGIAWEVARAAIVTFQKQ